MRNIKSKQSIEEFAANFLDEKKLTAFLNMNAFLVGHKFRRVRSGKSTWSIKYKNKRICTLWFWENRWALVCFNLSKQDEWFERGEKYISAELREFILDNLNTARSCCVQKYCNSVENVLILGKMITCRVCSCGPVKVFNPEGAALEYTKELILVGAKIITEKIECGIE